MNNYEATEIAYKNGYEQGKMDALKPIENDKVMERLTELLRNGILAAMDDEDRYLYTDVVDYMMAHGVTVATDNNVGDKLTPTADKSSAMWIPVSERLPKNFISVLVHIPEMNPCPAVMEAYRFDDGWVTKMAAFDINCATHWMPLPEPPKGE